jgi:hypothetical protein
MSEEPVLAMVFAFIVGFCVGLWTGSPEKPKAPSKPQPGENYPPYPEN